MTVNDASSGQAPSGQELVDEVRAASVATRIPMVRLLAPVTDNAGRWMARMEIVAHPLAETVRKVRAAIKEAEFDG